MNKQLPKKLAIASVISTLALTFAAAIAIAAPRSSTPWVSTNNDGVSVIPYVRADKKALFVDFENFPANTEYVYYNLNYDNRNTGVKNGVEGSFNPTPNMYTGWYGGHPYVRRQLLFGTCSQGVCVYGHPKNVTLTVNTKLTKGKVSQYSKVIKFPDSLF